MHVFMHGVGDRNRAAEAYVGLFILREDTVFVIPY